MQHLEIAQRMQLLTQKTLIDLSQELKQTKGKLEQAEQKLEKTEEEIRFLKENIPVHAQARDKAASLIRNELMEQAIQKGTEQAIQKSASQLGVQAIQAKQQQFIASCAFGAAKWKQYFGDVGVEPPLPSDIHTLLSSPCPFWPSKKVHETHLLVLIPQTVNGQPLTLKSLGELVKTPRQGNKTEYRYFNLGEYTDPPARASHWVLMTRDVIEGSRNKSYTEQQTLISQHAQKSGQPYQVPTVLDATVSIFMEYFQTGKRLYGNFPWTFTRCQEKYDQNWQLVVGGFSLELCVDDYNSRDDDYVGVGSLRKF